MSDLLTLGEKLTTTGAHKTEATTRRVRGLLGGKYIFDTTSAVYVWEHAYYPYFYIPKSEFADGVLEKPDSESKTCYHQVKLSAGEKTTDRVLLFDPSGALENLVRIEVSALDAWFVEDEKLLGTHPKDPYKRIECFPSSREIRIEVEGVVVAKSSQNVFLYETMLRPRFYLAESNVEWRYLRKSDTTSHCPYKGLASYYDIVILGKEIKDAVWYYDYPLSESALIQGRLCFYNEKVDVFIDGIPERV